MKQALSTKWLLIAASMTFIEAVHAQEAAPSQPAGAQGDALVLVRKARAVRI